MEFSSIQEEIEFLQQMQCIYPGDPSGSIQKYICELLGIEYEPIEIEVTYYG